MGNLDQNLMVALVTGTFVGAAAGYLGSLMIIKKMALVGDALSHVALPGIAIAIMFQLNPFIGAFIFLALAVIGIWILDQRSETGMETLIGIFFTASLSIGIILTKEIDLLESLFGDLSRLTNMDAILGIVLSLITIAITYKISRDVLLGTISKDLASSAGVNVAKTDFIFLFLVATIVALGIKIAGTLLTGALVIIPAAAARNISENFKSFSWLSLILGSTSSILGILISDKFLSPPGPTIVLVGTVIFLVTFLNRNN